MIPSFAMLNEQLIDNSDPELHPCNRKYFTIAKPGVSRVIRTVSSFSPKWGYILRVIYKGQVDGSELKEDQIFMCWRNTGSSTHYIISPFDEEAALRRNFRSGV